MLFNSWLFVLFFVVVYGMYLVLSKKHKAQNLLLLVASYIFYGAWDWRFLSLLGITTVVNHVIGLQLSKRSEERVRKILLALSLVINLGILGFFKYADFFAQSFSSLLHLFGLKADWVTLNIVLPVGISFYTFQALSYTIDIYRKKLTPTKSLLDFALFVSFFPQLVAGPIERATNLLPQVQKPRVIRLDQVNAGIYLVLWGFFKKLVIADNAAILANAVFNDLPGYQGLDLVIAALAFTVQIYGDFSGYSDIARGLAKLMGFDLMLNFKLPYFSISPSDFWNRWHISLSSWLRDYLYIPLGGNRGGSAKTLRNLMLTMALGGLWHGASWNFVIWGVYHGLLLILYRLIESNDPSSQRTMPTLEYVSKAMLMFILVVIGWVFFRARGMDQIVYYATHLGFSTSAWSLMAGFKLALISAPLFVVQLYQHVTGDLLIITKLRPVFRFGIYALMLVGLAAFAAAEKASFIYFQF